MSSFKSYVYKIIVKKWSNFFFLIKEVESVLHNVLSRSLEILMYDL